MINIVYIRVKKNLRIVLRRMATENNFMDTNFIYLKQTLWNLLANSDQL